MTSGYVLHRTLVDTCHTESMATGTINHSQPADVQLMVAQTTTYTELILMCEWVLLCWVWESGCHYEWACWICPSLRKWDECKFAPVLPRLQLSGFFPRRRRSWRIGRGDPSSSRNHLGWETGRCRSCHRRPRNIAEPLRERHWRTSYPTHCMEHDSGNKRYIHISWDRKKVISYFCQK